MKILVTGGVGFIGSAVVRLAISRGHSIVNVDARRMRLAWITLRVLRITPVIHLSMKISETEMLRWHVEKHQPDAVMHLTAESHVDRSIDGPADFIN